MRHTELVDVNEAARVTGLNPQTIYRLARQGRIRSFKVLRHRIRFERTDLAALIEESPAPASRSAECGT